MIILGEADLIGEADRGGNADLILGLVLAVAASALSLPVLRHGERLILGQLADVVQNALLIAVVRRLKFSGRGLVAEAERNARVHNGLTLEHVLEILLRDADVGKDVQIRQPAERGGLAAVGRLLVHFPDKLAAFKVQRVFPAVAADGRVKIARGILRGARAKAVETEREFIVTAGVVVVLAACVKLAENQLPVVTALFFVPVNGAAAAEVLDLDGAVGIARHDHKIAVTLARLVDGVG